MSSKDTEACRKKPRRGTSITPRTCLWPLTGSLLFTFGLSIGLTYRSNHHCYAGTCGEWLFPLQARLHVAIWYIWLALSTTFLAVRAFHPEMQRWLSRRVVRRKVPVVGKTVSRGGMLMVVWIGSLYGVVVAVWWERLSEYFKGRNKEGGIDRGGERLAAVALTGHLCDITMGMALLPISRHSALASFFQIDHSSTLANHVLTVYTLFLLVITHGALYISWIPIFNSLSSNLRRVVPVLNPTYLYTETWPGNTSSLGVWRASLIFTGSTAALIMLILFTTALPRVRQKYFNLFYFTHLLSIVMVVIICLHASTMFYCTSPGLAMWVLDWAMRLYELRAELEGSIEALGRGWYCISISLPRIRFKGCSCRSPLAHFYIHHADSSIRELHPFTTITHLATENAATDPGDDTIPIQFLFRKQGKVPAVPILEEATASRSIVGRFIGKRRQKLKSVQWTAKLAELADQGSVSSTEDSWPNTQKLDREKEEEKEAQYLGQRRKTSIPISLRLEGPYFSPADPHRYDTVICMVAGTGITGALAIASAFKFHCSNSSTTTSSSRSPDASSPACSSTPTTPPPQTSCAKVAPQQGGASDADFPTTPIPRLPAHRRWRKCLIFWSVKESEDVTLPIPLTNEDAKRGLEIRRFLTGQGRERVDLRKELEDTVDVEKQENEKGPAHPPAHPLSKTWVYISGPKPFIEAGKEACRVVGGQGREIDFYAASWDP